MTSTVRPTQHRLLLSLVPATIVVALMLQALAIIVSAQLPTLTIADSTTRALSVLLFHPAAPPDSTEAMAQTPIPEDVTATVEQSAAVPSEPLPLLDSAEPDARPGPLEAESEAAPGQSDPAVDWYRLAKSTSAEYVELLHAEEARREERWRTSGSVLFEPRADVPNPAEVNLLPDYRFLEPAGVLGLGIPFGECFVGLPLIGIPVEDRTPGITLFYCRR